MQNVSLQMLADKWPSSIVARTEIKKFTGGLLNEKYLANLDCQGIGPKGRMRIGRKICYPVDSVIAFLEGNAEAVESKKQGAAL